MNTRQDDPEFKIVRMPKPDEPTKAEPQADTQTEQAEQKEEE